jgi:hypothetical protein
MSEEKGIGFSATVVAQFHSAGANVVGRDKNPGQIDLDGNATVGGSERRGG